MMGLREWSVVVIVGGACAALLVGLVLWLGATLFYLPLHDGKVDFTVEGKERIADDGDGKWMVYAADGETFQITDNWLKGKTNSTDRYRELEVGQRYRCSTTGARWPLLSEYRNLLDCEVAR